MQFPVCQNALDIKAPLGSYYMDFRDVVSYTEGGQYGPFDSNGVPLIVYTRDKQKVAIYNPTTIAQYALGIMAFIDINSPVNNSEVSKYLNLSDWLVKNQIVDQRNVGVWQYLIDFPNYGLRAPWISALAQGQAISVLTRAYIITKDSSYLEAADRALLSFNYAYNDGGVTCWTAGDTWYEEYPSSQESHVLNGFIWALWGIYDYYRATSNPKALGMWENGVETLLRNLAYYDCGFWSVYDLYHKNLASNHYHCRVHIPQLEAMYGLTGESTFREYSQRWKDYSTSIGNRLGKEIYVRVIKRIRGFL